MIDIAGLRGAVDHAPDQVTALRGDLQRLYDHFGLPRGPSLSREGVTAALYKAISSSFATDHRAIWRDCERLCRRVVLDYVLFDQPLDPYFAVLKTIQDATRNPPTNASASDNWDAAIRAACDYVRLSPWNMDYETRLRINAREFAVAFAAKDLRERGFQIELQDDRPTVAGDAEGRLIDRLALLVRAIAGINVAAIIFHKVSSLYDPQQERYHLVRRVSQSGQPPYPNIPFGYLFLLAAKYPFTKPETDNLDANWAELEALSADFAALFNVQPYNIFQLMFKDHTTVIPFLQELALYDALFTIPQLRPLDAIRIVRGVLSWLDWEREYDGSWKLTEAVKIANQILEIGRTRRGPVPFRAGELASFCDGVSVERISYILEHIFSHRPPGANQDYTVPTDTGGLNFFHHPLLSDGHGEHWLLDASACAPAFVEALFRCLRATHSDLNDKLGRATERFLRAELEAHGVTVSSGNYRSRGAEGECDLVVETSDVILFFEIKMKALTRIARAGSDAAVLIDLACSLLEAQLQAGRREVQIRKFGYLDLVDDQGRNTHIELRGRQIERIAVTLFDYGSFQDRMVLQQFLEINLNANYTVTDVSLQKKFAKLEEKLRKLRQQAAELVSLDSNRRDQPFFHCWFLSVPQILVLLDSVNSNEDMKVALWNTRHISAGSLDFYFEHTQAMKLRSQECKVTNDRV